MPMNKYEQVILTYYTVVNTDLDYFQDPVTKTFKNATFMFDTTYTTVATKRDSFTIPTSSVISIECKESLDD